MGTFQNPIGSGPKDPFDKTYRIEPVEEENRNKDHPENKPGPRKNEELGVIASLLSLFEKAVDFLIAKASIRKSSSLSARENLLLLKAAFETLKMEDRSQDVVFLNQLSKIWRFAIENAIHFKNDEAASKFKTLVKKIQHYPENQTHTFGYYLTENAEQRWVPFPYMELITKIHTEHEKYPDGSPLAEWTLLIDEIASLLKGE